MPLPDYQKFMLPLLQYLSDGQTRSRAERAEWLANHFQLTEAQREELLPSGKSTTLYSRMGWAGTYLLKAGLLDRPARGRVRITPRGMEALEESHRGTPIDIRYLRRFPEFVAFESQAQEPGGTGRTTAGDTPPQPLAQTPQEAMEAGYQALRAALASDLLDRIKSGSPKFFEQLVLDLLVAMGYGGSRSDAARAVGGSGDGGVDGYIKEDKLGLDSIYLQAKRWQESVGRPIVQAFAGSLEGHRARKGVLITTSRFSQDAHDYVRRIEKRIVLIDGRQLTDLMIDYGVGVTEVVTYAVKRLDEDYFEEP
ncbi:MAG: restriction endonuclease [Thermomicrobiales bacterium]